MKFGIADYGMNVWDGGLFDIEARLDGLKSIGYEGTERLVAVSASDAVQKAGTYRRLGMDFALCLGPDAQSTLQWTSAFRKDYVWTQVSGRDFDTFCRQVNHQCEMAARWGIQVGLHNHLGSLVESQAQLEAFLAKCPKCGLVLDTAHLAAADGDGLEIVKKYADRLVAVHLKDWLVTNPAIGLDRWGERGRFCELGAGNIGLDNAAILKAVARSGYNDWVFVEHDTHLRDPLKDLAVSRQYIRNAGF
jgi:sugar phosphate isomerase/epimerase